MQDEKQRDERQKALEAAMGKFKRILARDLL